MNNREKILMDIGWKFHYGDIISIRNRWAWGKSGSWNQGPESAGFDDSDWLDVDIPHDFVIETKPIGYFEQEFGEENVIPAMENVANIHTTAGSFQKNVGWYRKHFFIPKEDEGKKIEFIFDGVYRESSVYLNEFFIGFHRSGYTGVSYDISDFINYGGDNIISIRTDSRNSEGWFYEGGGIYRHTYILKTNKVNIKDVFVSCDVDVQNKTAKAYVKAEFENNNENIHIVTNIIDPNGNVVCTVCGDCSLNEIILDSEITNAMLWDIDTPNMYKCVTNISIGNEIVDEYECKFGIRDIYFDADKGFFLNGKKTKIKGVCCHQNHGGLGVALPDEMYYYRIQKLKEAGVNGYRTAHYPPTPELLDVCDELGMLVMDETRLLSSAKEDLQQLEFMVRRDRNHPSVIMYSIGNEEAQSQTTSQGAKIATTMIEHIRKIDDTKPITMALLMWDLKNKVKIDDIGKIAGISEQLDVAGFNYQDWNWSTYHATYPNQPMICTEQGTFKSTRGCYVTDSEKCHLSIMDKDQISYMKGAVDWRMAKPDYMSGLFLWTGFDYYGEPTPYAWPAISSQFGMMDICGYPKDFYYYYKAWWSDEDVVHIFPHWNWNEGDIKDLYVFSDCDEVEVFVNGESFGRKSMPIDDYLVWENVKYHAGEVCAKGYKNGEFVKEDIVRTAGEPYKVKLSVDFAKNNIAVIKAKVVDENNIFVPYADNEIEFVIEGNGKILGTSNGDPSDHTEANSPKRKVFNGLAQAIIKYDGSINIKAITKNICGDEIKINN